MAEEKQIINKTLYIYELKQDECKIVKHVFNDAYKTNGVVGYKGYRTITGSIYKVKSNNGLRVTEENLDKVVNGKIYTFDPVFDGKAYDLFYDDISDKVNRIMDRHKNLFNAFDNFEKWEMVKENE